MRDILDYFEDMDEGVYIADWETHDLIYLNKALRNKFGYFTHEEYAGKKCYEILNGSDAPCPLCNKKQLKDKNWVSWIYTSPEDGKQFLVKDRKFNYKGKQYRIEVSLDIQATAGSNENKEFHAIYDSMVRECLQRMGPLVTTEESIEQTLAYIGTELMCDRVYIIELHDDGFMSNTYEWCAEGAVPQKEILQKEPVDCIDWWLDQFKKKNNVVIEDIETIKIEHPMTYSTLKPQDISSMAVAPLYINNEIYGFVGVDNIDKSKFHLIHPFLEVMEKVFGILIKRRDIFNHLEKMSFHDSLTGAFNSNALLVHYKDTSAMKSLGLTYFEITGLEHINDNFGQDACNFMIRKCCAYIHDLLKTDDLYRTDSNTFISVYPDCSEAEFSKQVELLKEKLRTYQYHIAHGSVWSDQRPLAFVELVAKANKLMCQDKQEHFAKRHMIQAADMKDSPIPTELASLNSPYQFMTAISLDVENFFHSLQENNGTCYYYFGDVQKNLYYISDNLRDDLGFENNIVPNFLKIWGEFIATIQDQKSYLQKLEDLMQGDCSNLDFMCPIRDVNGRTLWVQFYGSVTWDQEKKSPVSISGHISHQNNEFVVDSVTNFPQAAMFWDKLDGAEITYETCHVIGFCFNHITEINHIYGRHYVNQLLGDVAAVLFERLSDKVSFYRSEGMRFIAVIHAGYEQKQEILIHQIGEIVKDCYHRCDLFFPHPCSVAALEYVHSEVTVDEFRNQLESMVKLAKRTPEKKYIQSSDVFQHSMKEASNMALALNKNVLNEMENFRIVIQPVVSAQGGAIKGGEVLLRWKFQGEDVSPAIFIPLLEKSNMIHSVGRWVFEQAARVCSRIVSYYPDFYLSFNVSLYQLNDMGFIEFIQHGLDKYHLDASHLVAEMTESCLDKQPEMLRCFIQNCKKIGLRPAMDDFGSGYSSLRMLLQYPYNIIKMDRSLLQEITVSEESQSFVRSLVSTCHYCNKQVCVEGVETEAENTIISETECDTIQGYYHYRPMELNQFYELMNRIEL